MRLISRLLLPAILAPALVLQAQVNRPEITRGISNMEFSAPETVTFDLREHFGLNFVEVGNPDRSTIVQFTVQAGDETEIFDLLLFPRAIAPRTIDNFLAYVDAERYDNVAFHRLALQGVFVLQGGGYFPNFPDGFPEDFPTGEPNEKVETFEPIPLEFNLPNFRGRVSMARLNDPNSATSQFFINLGNNSTTLGPSNGGGFAAFANVMSFGMDAVDRLAATPVFNGGGVFSEVPLVDFDPDDEVDPEPENFLTITSVRRAQVYPGGPLPAVLSFEATSSNEDVVMVSIEDNELTVDVTGTDGIAFVTVTASDTSGAEVRETFTVNAGNVPAPPSSFHSLATRALTIGGDTVVIAGFTITGPDAKRVLVRNVGPTLFDFGVSSALVAPIMTLNRLTSSGNQLIAVNDNWEDNENAEEIRLVTSQVGAFPLRRDVADNALLEVLEPGSYTVTASGRSGATGICLVELYDADLTPNDSRFTSISSRVPIGNGQAVAIPGFVVSGVGSRTYLIRVAGPKLADFGLSETIVDPQLVVFRSQGGNQVEMGRNDNWEDDDAAAVTAATSAVGAFSFDEGESDAAIVLELEPGVYTVVVSGVGGVNGLGLVEVYEVPTP